MERIYGDLALARALASHSLGPHGGLRCATAWRGIVADVAPLWFRYVGRLGCVVVQTGSEISGSGLLNTEEVFTLRATVAVTALGEVLADPERLTRFGADQAEVPFELVFERHPRQRDEPRGPQVAMVRVIGPSHVPARHWLTLPEKTKRETTSISYVQMTDAVRQAWRMQPSQLPI